MDNRRVAILGGGLFRPDRVRYENAEEGVAIAFRNLLEEIPNLDPREIEFVQSSYFSDHLNQQLCMAWIVQDYIGLKCHNTTPFANSFISSSVPLLSNKYVYFSTG